MTFDMERLEIKPADVANFATVFEQHNPSSRLMPLRLLRDFAAALPGIWQAPVLANPACWYNELLLELGLMRGQDLVNAIDHEQMLGYRHILLAILLARRVAITIIES